MLLREAAHVADAAGAATELRLATKELRRLGIRPADHSLPLLTRRERESADLIREGASNVDIA